MDNGQLVPDELVVDLLKDEVKKHTTKSVLLDGFPHNVKQAEFLNQSFKVDEVLNLKVIMDVCLIIVGFISHLVELTHMIILSSK
jgi:adenylate kinase